MATRISNEERRKRVTDFYERALQGLSLDPAWIDGQIDASVPALPDAPNPEQLAAWVELEALLDEPALAASKRVNASDAASPPGGSGAFAEVTFAALTATADARARGVSPRSSEAAAIAERFATSLAAVAGHGDVARMREHLRVKYEPRGARYWELVAILRGGDEPPQRFDDWRWLGEALGASVPQ